MACTLPGVCCSQLRRVWNVWNKIRTCRAAGSLGRVGVFKLRLEATSYECILEEISISGGLLRLQRRRLQRESIQALLAVAGLGRLRWSLIPYRDCIRHICSSCAVHLKIGRTELCGCWSRHGLWIIKLLWLSHPLYVALPNHKRLRKRSPGKHVVCRTTWQPAGMPCKALDSNGRPGASAGVSGEACLRHLSAPNGEEAQAWRCIIQSWKSSCGQLAQLLDPRDQHESDYNVPEMCRHDEKSRAG